MDPDLHRRVAFGSAYEYLKDKVAKLKRLFEVDETFTELMQSFFSTIHVPRSYIKTEFPECKSLFDYYDQHDQIQGRQQKFLVGSAVEGASMCRLLKYPRCYGEFDMLWVKHKLANEKCGKLVRHSGQPGWYWVETSISESVITQKKNFMEGIPPLYRFTHPETECVMSEVGPSAATEITFPQIDGSTMTSSSDYVPAVKLDFWPSEAWEWVHRSRKWPHVPLVVDITQTPCFLVHKPFRLDDPFANEWYISFTLAEKIIARKRSEGMQMTYFFFKAIYYCSLKYTSEEKEFGSYLAKTTMMWACEEYPIHQWTPDNLDANIRILLEKLLGYIDKRFLPHYFIPELNLLSRLPESLFTMMEEHLDRDRLLNDPMSFIPEDVLDYIIVGQFRAIRYIGMHRSIMTEIKRRMGWKTYTKNYHDFYGAFTRCYLNRLCQTTLNSIPYDIAMLFDPDELITNVSSKLNDDALRLEIKKEIEYMKRKLSHRHLRRHATTYDG